MSFAAVYLPFSGLPKERGIVPFLFFNQRNGQSPLFWIEANARSKIGALGY